MIGVHNYDANGNLLSTTDERGNATIYTYDKMNRVTEVTDHNGRKTAYGWDNVGNKTVQGYTDGTQVDYYDDEENQIVEIPSVDTE